jgi:regulatory protein
MSDRVYNRVFELATKLLSRRARSVGQMRERLLKKIDAPEAVERTIERLIELGYLNDEEFAYNYANNRLSIKAMGRDRMRRALIEKQISPETADLALTRLFGEQDERELCDRAMAKHMRIHGRPADAKQSRKLFTHLLRLGFSYDLVIKKLRSLKTIDDFGDQ